MTGPEHYKEAERVLDMAGSMSQGSPEQHAAWVAEAQVHATLAFVAAIAEPIAQKYDGDYDTAIPAAWSAAIS